jgi:hypothetical protein
MILTALLFSCPWLNQATAAGVLGGRVTQMGCNFYGKLELHIEMIEEFKPRCEALKGIGNEAYACPGEVAFRMRDKIFRVQINTDDRDKIRKVAEMVAGSMF